MQSGKLMWVRMKSGLKKETSSGETEDTAEIARNQYASQTTLRSSACRLKPNNQKVRAFPNFHADRPPKPRRLWRYHCRGNLRKYPVPRNLRAVPGLLKRQGSLHPPNQLTVQKFFNISFSFKNKGHCC